MKNTNELIETLKELVMINNDRVAGYEQAAEQTKNFDNTLHTLFLEMADQSRTCTKELEDELKGMGSLVEKNTTVPGKIFRVWMNIKHRLKGWDRNSIIESCAFGENAAQKAYTAVLNSNTSIPGGLLQIIKQQKAYLKISLEQMERLGDKR